MGRHQNCRHAHTEAIESEVDLSVPQVVGRNCRGGRHMVIESAVFVVEDYEQRAVPQFFPGAYPVVHVSDQPVAVTDVVRGMLIGLLAEKDFEILGLDERKIRKVAFIAFCRLVKIVHAAINIRVLPGLSEQHGQ